jgi:predicted methyltransferase
LITNDLLAQRERLNTLQAYAMGLMNKYRYLKRIVGIASEPLPKATDRRESSEDLIILEIPEWTLELEQEAQRLCQEFGIMKEGRYQERSIRGREYPSLPNSGSRR